MDMERATPGSADLQLADGVRLLRPDEQVFTAMLDGWRNRQLARNSSFGTVESRQRSVRAFAEHAQVLPWRWTPQLVDEWCTDLRAVRRVRRSTLRGYQEAVRLFCAYLTDPAYGWVGECEKRFGPTGRRFRPAAAATSRPWPPRPASTAPRSTAIDPMPICVKSSKPDSTPSSRKEPFLTRAWHRSPG